MEAKRAQREQLVGHLDATYAFALSLTGDAEEAGEVCQEACVRALESGVRGPDERKDLMRSVYSLAANLRRAERRRAARERRAAARGEARTQGPLEAAGARARAERVRLAVAGLREELRAPVFLHYMQGMTAREAGEVLGLTEKAVRRRVERGLEELRRSFTGAGLALAPAALLLGLREAGAIRAPEALVRRVSGALTRAGTSPAAGAAAAKGGMAMKILAGVVLAGAVAGGVAVSMRGWSEPLPAEAPKKKFSIPVWHPDARWEKPKEPFAHTTRVPGILDGPRREVMSVWKVMPTLMGGFVGSGRYVFLSYDEKTERFHPATRGARGNLDGPFSRARFSYGNYHDFHMHTPANDGRFYYMVANWWTGWVRALDFATQTVSTLPAEGIAVTPGESGKVYLVNGRRPVSEVTVLSPGPEWKVLKKQPLQGNQNVNGLGFVLAVDEKRGRLYGTTYRADPWYVWYWDLKDGSYHGVLPNCHGKPGARRQGEAGPFKGTVVYNHGEIGWGPDDPEKRHLYMTRVDDASLYRLDLGREVLMVFNDKEGRFVDRERGTRGTYGRMPLWLGDGSFVGSVPTFPGNIINRFRRVK